MKTIRINVCKLEKELQSTTELKEILENNNVGDCVLSAYSERIEVYKEILKGDYSK